MARAASQTHAVQHILPVAQQLAQTALCRAASVHQTQVVISPTSYAKQKTGFWLGLKVLLYRYVCWLQLSKWQVWKLLPSLGYSANATWSQNNGDPPCR